MINKNLIQYCRKQTDFQKDYAEKAANILLKPARCAWGREITVLNSNTIEFTEGKKLQKIQRLFCAAVSILVFPLTIIGLLCAANSRSHAAIHKKHQNYLASKKVTPLSPPSQKSPAPSPLPKQTQKVVNVVTKPRQPAPFTPIPHNPIENWAEKAEKMTKEQIKERLGSVLEEWNRSPAEERLKREKKGTQIDLTKFNEAIFAFVKQNKKIETPRDFLWSLKEQRLQAPIPVGHTVKSFIPEEGQFYKIDPWGDTPFRKPHDGGEGGDSMDCAYFATAFKREGNSLKLYLDGHSYSGIYINEKVYSCTMGHGKNTPSYILKEGDVVYTNIPSSYLFTVGKGGTILFSDKGRHEPEQSEEGEEQSSQLKLDLSKTRDPSGNGLTYTNKKRAAEIGMDTPLAKGFSIPSAMSTDPTAEEQNDKLFVDPENDPIMDKLVGYLKEEFSLLQYTETEKMVRLAFLTKELLKGKTWGFNKQNYLLGELVRAGNGVCRHRALLIKALADRLELNCALLFGEWDNMVTVWFGQTPTIAYQISGSGHAWNVALLDGKYWIVDAMHSVLFPVDKIPGKEKSHQNHMQKNYGIEDCPLFMTS